MNGNEVSDDLKVGQVIDVEFKNNEDAASNVSLWSGDLEDISDHLKDNELEEALSQLEETQEKLNSLHKYLKEQIDG